MSNGTFMYMGELLVDMGWLMPPRSKKRFP